MSIPTFESSAPLVCVIDRDPDSLPIYHRLAEAQGLRLRFHSTVHELREAVSLNRIMVLVLDVEADQANAVSLLRDLIQREVPSEVILTTSDRYSEEVVAGLALGAVALLNRPWGPESMSKSMEHAAEQYEAYRRLYGRLVGFRQIIEGLSERQRTVLALAATGMPNKLIATQIEVSQRTVETERSRLLEAFGVESCADAMIRYGEYGVLEQIETIRKRNAEQRLGIPAANAVIESFGAELPS